MAIFQKFSVRTAIAYGHDIFQAIISFLLTVYLRFSGTNYNLDTSLIFQSLLIFAGIATIVFWLSGLYRGLWRYASIDDMMAVTRAVSGTILIFVLVMFLWTRLDDLPRSVPVINWFILMALLGGPRFIYRFAKDYRRGQTKTKLVAGIPVILVGAGDSADHFIRGLRQNRDKNYTVIGILSEKPNRVGHQIRGINVLGITSELEAIIRRLHQEGVRPQRLILTEDNLDGASVRQLFDVASTLGMTVARIPKATDFRTAEKSGTRLQPIAIEDLLGRPQTPLNRMAMRSLINMQVVLITGAGGSIGAELTRQAAALNPSALILLDHSEFATYNIEQEINLAYPGLRTKTILADIRDSSRILAILKDHAPEVVFHAAALKHVPLVEKNATEGVLTNVLGTKNVADACRAVNVHTMVLVSTDKAVNPRSVMGVTKRIAEIYCQTLDKISKSNKSCHFITVRFGNVLGSTGSVVPLFQKQLLAGGPLTVTDPEMIRYFMTIKEAVELILEAAAMGTQYNRNKRGIFVLDMGEPVKILHLAEQMIRLSGLIPGEDIKIQFTGIRPGEKLSEEVLHDAEHITPSNSPGIFLASSRTMKLDLLTDDIENLIKYARNNNYKMIKRTLSEIVPEYSDTKDGN